MDPNEALRRARAAIETRRVELDADAEADVDNLNELYEAFQDLDVWLSKRGFLPADWSPEGEANPFNGARVVRRGNTIFVPLPRSCWRSAGQCSCDHCKGGVGYWDTLAVTEDASKQHQGDTTWPVHAPEMHRR